MNKKARLELIRHTYRDSRRQRRKLTPKLWQFIKELRQENKQEETGVILDFNENDIREEIQLMNSCPARMRL